MVFSFYTIGLHAAAQSNTGQSYTGSFCIKQLPRACHPPKEFCCLQNLHSFTFQLTLLPHHEK